MGLASKRPPEPQKVCLTTVRLSDRLCPQPAVQLSYDGIDKRRMSWTTERPKLVGVYWHRATPASLSHPVKIYSVGTLFYVWPIEEDARAGITVRLDVCSGEWAGPMVPPV